jgi:hypothetical protein
MNSQTRSLKVKNDNFLYAREMKGKEVENGPGRHESIHQLLVATTIITRVTTRQHSSITSSHNHNNKSYYSAAIIMTVTSPTIDHNQPTLKSLLHLTFNLDLMIYLILIKKISQT